MIVDWDFEDYGGCSYTLDTSIKYEGAASLKCTSPGYGLRWLKVSRKNYSVAQVRIIWWGRWTYTALPELAGHIVGHSSYGEINLRPYFSSDTWAKFRVSFWYDSPTNMRFGRIEKWVNGNWVKQIDDILYGSGSPASSTIYLKHLREYSLPTAYITNWFDVVEVYSAAL